MTALAQAEAVTDRNPSLPQIGAGNYRKGKYRIHGMRVSIENPRGSIRSAKDGSWKVRMPCAYGYILGTKGADKDHIDCFLGPHHRSPLVYVINQKDARTGKWDEHKTFIGFASPKQVKRAYESAFSDGRGKDRIGDLHELTVAQFRDWLSHGDTTKPMKRRASGGRVFRADGGQASDPNDLTDQYNTALSPKDEAAFQQWAAANPRLGNTYDYDARGFWQAGAGAADNGHGSDQWKKPNHPTFSTQSQYSGADGNNGGQWNVRPDGTWSFVPSATNLKYSDPDDLRDYFAAVEPDNRLVLPSDQRASGGRIGMADGGVPAFDPSKPFEAVQPPAFDPSKPFEPVKDADSGFGWSQAVTDIPHEIGEEAGKALSGITERWDNRDNSGPVDNLLSTGKMIASVPRLIASPLTGAARSVIGHTMANLEHKTGEAIAPEIAAKDNPQAMYEQAKADTDMALAAARPAGEPIKVGGAYEWKPPSAAAAPKQKPVGVVAQPETESFFDAADNHYANMRGFGVEIDPRAMNGVADNILNELHAEGYRPRNAPKVFDAIEELHNPAGQNHEISDIDSVRKVLGKARLDPSERDAARRAIGHIDDYLANLGKNPQDVVVNPQFAARVGEEAQAARANYAVAKRSEDIDEALDQAERQAARAGSGGNINNAIRQRLSALRNNKKKMAGWTDDEKAELDKVINGTKGANAARQAGKFAPHGIVSTVMSAGAGHAIMPGVGEVAVPAAGLVAKMVGDRMTRVAAERLQNVVKARSPLGRQTSINAAAQSALTQSNSPRLLPAAVRAALPYTGPNLGPLRQLQGPVPSSANQEQQ